MITRNKFCGNKKYAIYSYCLGTLRLNATIKENEFTNTSQGNIDYIIELTTIP